MNKYFLFLTILLLFNICNTTDIGNVIKLPEPKRQGGMPLFEALNIRQSSRDFNDSIRVTPEIISQALWSCYGIRQGNLRTVPSSKAWYPFTVYLFLEEGVFTYNPEGHELTKIFDGDHREITGTQTEIVTKARVGFVFVADLNKPSVLPDSKEWRRKSAMADIGHVTMTLYLFAASYRMKGIARGSFDEDKILTFLGLNKEDYYLPLTFSLGY
jgi:SagB-type dehydrogenase family enzyme